MASRKNPFEAVMEAHGLKFVKFGGCGMCDGINFCHRVARLTRHSCPEVCFEHSGSLEGKFVKNYEKGY